MKNTFFLKLVLFLGPVALYLLIAIGISLYVGEIVSLREVASRQMGADPILFGRAYKDNWHSFKLIATNLRKPEILTLGSSRVMQFRSMFFNLKSDAFYNAGGGASSIYQMRTFLQHVDKDALPKLLIIGLDQEWFNPNWSGVKTTVEFDTENRIDIAQLVRVVSAMAGDVISGKAELGKMTSQKDTLHQEHAIGLNAVINSMGFRNDGSYQYGELFLTPSSTEERMLEALERVADGRARFNLSDEVAVDSLVELDHLLQFCQSNNIAVVGFSPPYAPTVYQAMLKKGGYDYIPQSIVKINELFDRYSYKYFDFTDIAKLGITDDDMLDGFHASEYGVLRMYLHMLQNSGNLLTLYSDETFLKETLTRPNRFALFEN